MMQQAALARWQPTGADILSRSVRWSVVAAASVAVPMIVLGAALGQPAAVAPTRVVAPVTIEQPVLAPISEAAPPVESAPAPVSSDIPVRPAYDLSQVELYFDPGCECLGWF